MSHLELTITPEQVQYCDDTIRPQPELVDAVIAGLDREHADGTGFRVLDGVNTVFPERVAADDFRPA